MQGIARFFVILLAAALSGCFVSDKELISAADSVAPYQRISFQQVGSQDSSTLIRAEGGYRTEDKDNPTLFRFKQVEPDVYVVQASATEDGKTMALYALIRLDRAAKTAYAYEMVADDKESVPGMTRCKDGLCFDRLDTYLSHARAVMASGARPESEYKILALE